MLALPAGGRAMPTATIPVTITPDAEALAAEWGIRAELEQMIEHTKQVVPDVVTIEVKELENYDEPEDIRVIIEAWQSGEFRPDENIFFEWIEWARTAFPVSVWTKVTFDHIRQDSYGR
jgi:hypothetical protein